MSQPTILTRRRALDFGLSDRDLRRATAGGELVRVQRGAYVNRDAETPRDRHLLRINAAGLSTQTVVSDWSAAAVHGIPVLEAHLVQVYVVRSSNCRNRQGRLVRARKAELRPDEIVHVSGVRCTSLERTVQDLLSTRDLGEALAIADAALQLGVDVAGIKPDRRAPKRALQAIRLADRRSQSFLESYSRAKLTVLKIPPPELQVEIFDAVGRFVARVDMAWTELGVIGEADGLFKYTERFGSNADKAIAEEKRRHQRLEALGWMIVRWDFAAVRGDGALLGQQLRAAFARASHLPAPQGSHRFTPR